jgi:hypothetical protein
VVRDQLLSTRAYRILLITSLAIPLLFTSVTRKIVSITVLTPSLEPIFDLSLHFHLVNQSRKMDLFRQTVDLRKSICNRFFSALTVCI